MGKCIKCGRHGLFFRVSKDGLCADCAAKIAEAEERRRKAAEERQREEEARKQREAEAREEARKALELRRQKFADYLASIPRVDFVTTGEKKKLRDLSGFRDLKYSNITSRSDREKLGEYVAIDLETTGLRVTCSVIEISAIKFSKFLPVSIFTTLLKPTEPIPEEATRINGITDDMVANAPYLYQIMPSLEEYIGSSNIIGYNLPFDLKYLHSYGLDIKPKQKLFDTLSIAKRTLKKANYTMSNDWDVVDYRLETVCAAYGIAISGAHRSAADALAAGALFAQQVDERLDSQY